MSLLRKKPGPADIFRPLLYGDVPPADWAAMRGGVFAQAAADPSQAVVLLRGMAAEQGAESRDRLQAFAALRALNVRVEPVGQVLGVVLDVPVAGAVDTVAAYEDGRARLLNHSGAIAVVEPGPSRAS